MNDYRLNRQWSDSYIPAIKRIVGPILLEPSSFEIDTQQATDLVILKARDMAIAARVRRPGYAERYPYEFTLRAKVGNGATTELSKVTDGWGDWFFYGHASDDPGEIAKWFLIDLAVWRASFIRHPHLISKGMKSNGDGTHFAWFDIRSFPPAILIASSDIIEFRHTA